LITKRILAGFLLVLSCLCARPLVSQDWPMFLGNQQLTADNDGIPPAVFKTRWTWTAHSPIYRAVPAPDAVLVTTAAGEVILISSSGKTLWTRRLAAPVIRPPIIWRGSAWVLAGRGILCLDLSDGRTIWSRNESAATQLVTPAVSQGILFHGTRTGIQARIATNGQPVWTNPSISAWGAALVVIEDNLLVQHRNYRTRSSFLACLDTGSGATRWTREIPHEANIFAPLVVGERVFQAAHDTLAVFSLRDGTSITNIRFSAPLASHPAATGPLLILPLTDGTIVTLSSTTFSVQTTFSHLRRQGNILAVSSQYLYCATDSGSIAELSVTNGKVGRSLPLPAAASHAQPFLRDGLLYVPSQTTLICIGPPHEARPDTDTGRTSVQRILVLLDARTKNPLPGIARIAWQDGHAGIREAGIGFDGSGSAILPESIPVNDISLTIQRRGYVYTNSTWPRNTGRLVVHLEPIDAQTRLVLNDILFDTGSASLLPQALPSLHRLARFMQANPALTVLIEGHTDDVGDRETNLALSLARAGSIREYLVRQGIGGWRIRTTGFGPDRPVAPNTTAEGRMRNRRTEIRIL